jgi:predicted  nucleic acid-binding Zn-ribbon protein
MIKDWLVLGSVAFSVGFGLSLPFTKDVRQSLLAGATTVPAASAGVWAVTQWRKSTIAAAFSSLQSEVQTLEDQRRELQRSLEQTQQQATLVESDLQTQQQVQQQLEQTTTTLESRKQELEEDTYRLQKWLEELRTQEIGLNRSLSQFAIDVERSRNQQQHLQAQLSELELQRSQQDSTRQQIDQELANLNRDHELAEGRYQSLQAQLQVLVDQKQEAEQTLADARDYKQNLEAELQQIQPEITGLRQQRDTLAQEIATLDNQQYQLEEDAERSQQLLEALRAQEEQLNQALARLVIDIEQHRTEKQQIQAQLDELGQQLYQRNDEKERAAQELDDLKREYAQLESQRHLLQVQLQTLIDRRSGTQQTLTDLDDRKQQLETTLQQLQPEVLDLRQQRDALNEEITTLSFKVGELTEALPDMQDVLEDVSQQSVTDLELDIVRSDIPKVVHSLELDQAEFDPPTTIADFRLANSDHTRWLWEEVIEPRLRHRPFLGSVSLPKFQSDAVWGSEDIIDIVAQNLRRQGENNIEYNTLLERFGDFEQNWLKILTFALSEYAYYAEENIGFWKGVCDRFQLTYQGDQQMPIPALRDLAKEGIDLLQLPKAVGGYSIVSTLWLQNGIPRHNLNHFAELVALLVGQWGWQYIANAETSLLASELLSLCRQRFPGRTVLIRFLEASCSSGTEPITGKLLQSIANVALALHSQKLRPDEVLLNAERREAFLTELPRSNFFLRDWEAFVEILASEPKHIRKYEVRRGEESLLLKLDVDDLLIQLVLPEQRLADLDWIEGSCVIPDAGWEGYISDSGEIEIEEQIETVNEICENWCWQLLDSDENCLHEWHLEGVTPEFPCLIFDAWTGERIFAEPNITGSSEIIYFTTKADRIEASPDIDLVDADIPCSLTGWHGQRFRLNTQSTTIRFRFSEQTIELRWSAIEHSPTLKGLKLKGTKPKFLKAPTLWYPPSLNDVRLNLDIQDLGNNACLTDPQQVVSIPLSIAWSGIRLDQWITKPGNYEVHLKTDESEWTERFEIECEYHVNAEDYAFFGDLDFIDETGQSIPLPIVLQDANKFWQKTITITGLWTLENIGLLLTDGKHQVSRTVQANAHGCLTLELATLHDVLPLSNRYTITYQRFGQSVQTLIELSLEANDVD